MIGCYSMIGCYGPRPSVLCFAVSVGALFSMADRTVLVTGASGALGARFAEVLIQAGARVIGTARRPDNAVLAALAARHRERFVPACLDITDDASIDALLARLIAEDREPQVLINNAGIASSARAVDTDDALWRRVTATNLDGPRRLMQRWAERRIQLAQPGAVVNITSVLATRTMPGTAPYAAAKAGLLHLGRSLAIEWARHGIRVNALSPGYIATDINAAFFASDAGQRLIARMPGRALGRPEDLDGALLLLASEASRHLSGSEIVVDGGHSVASL